MSPVLREGFPPQATGEPGGMTQSYECFRGFLPSVLSVFLFVSPLFTEFALNSATIACEVLAVCVKIRVRMP